MPPVVYITCASAMTASAQHLSRVRALQVDVNLTLEKCTSKVSRLQCLLEMDLAYGYLLRNIGRQTVMVNNVEVPTGHKIKLPHMSLLEVGTAQLLFLINIDAMQRACLQQPPLPKESIGL